MTTINRKNLFLVFVVLFFLNTTAEAFYFHTPYARHETRQEVAPSNDDSVFGSPQEMSHNQMCDAQVFRGVMPIIVNINMTVKTEVGCFDEYTVLDSGITRTPLWSAEHLTRYRVDKAESLPRVNSFHPEQKLPDDYRAELSDYVRSGYDRGHNAPNKDFDTPLAQWQCFSLANMMPQNPNNNRVLWEGIESATRKLAQERGELYVVTGPIFNGRTIMLHNRVMVPNQIYKAILDPSTGRGAAYLVNNTEGMNYVVISIAKLQQITGIDVFPSMTDASKTDAMQLPEPTPHNHETAY